MRFLFVDRILDSVPGEKICGLTHVTADDFYLIPGRLQRWQFMPALIGESLGQLAAWNVMNFNQFSARPVAGVVSRVNLGSEASPGDTVFLEAQIERLDDTAVQYNASAYVDGAMVAEVEGALGPLMPMQDFIDRDTVEGQFAEIYRPGSIGTRRQTIAVEPADPTNRCTAPGFDALVSLAPGESMQMVKNVSRCAPYFPDHFPRRPVLPMTILIQSKISMATAFIAQSGYEEDWCLCRLQRIKMNTFVHPGDSVYATLKVKRKTPTELVLAFHSEVEDRRVCVMEAVFEAREKNNA